MPNSEQIGKILLSPSAETVGAVAAQVDRTPAIDDLATGKVISARLIQRFFLQRERTRRMAATAMTQSLY